MSRKVLVLGCDSRSGLAVVRSLGRQGIEVHVGWHQPNSIALYSRYVSKVHTLAEYSEADRGWLGALTRLLEAERFDLVIPTTDESMLPVVRERLQLEKLVKLAIPSEHAFLAAYVKSKTAELARSLGVAVPRQVAVSSEADFSAFDVEWEFPLVIKPVSSKFIRAGRIAMSQVSYANCREDLLRKLRSLLDVTPVVVQEYFVGTGMGIEVLCEGGEILCAFQHERLHEPMYGGGSSYRKSVRLDPPLLTCAERLLSELKWTGVAMLEFRYNKRTREFVLLEINGRFWGSLPLALAAGMDFPYYSYQLLVEGRRDFPARYNEGICCRNLYLDFSWRLSNLFTRPSEYNNALPLWWVLCEVANVLLLRERCDSFVLDDLRPGFREIRLIFDRIRSRLSNFFLTYWLRLPAVRHGQQKRILRQAGKARLNICFICKGNICRSPFAEYYFEKVCVNKRLEIGVESTGYYPQASRRCPAEAVSAARRFEVDLSGHRSSVLCEEKLSQKDFVFVFDIESWGLLRQNFRRYKSKVFLLGSIGDNSRVQMISDPYGQDEKAFAETYSHMASLLDSLAKAMAHD
jgi:protein-tyrosine-phosphatase/predicted ATP-grasp superfamily ATP-dependent carboligase